MKKIIRFKKLMICIFLILLFFVVFKINYKPKIKVPKKYTTTILYVDRTPFKENFKKYETVYENKEKETHLPSEYTYKKVDTKKLKKWLLERESLLGEEPYFSEILLAAENSNISPYLLFAIAGQEQGFVKKTAENAKKIANNPFNVYGSWQKYNTNIKDATEIASRTIINLSKSRPESVDTLKWINLRGGKGGYAEDENWWVGVSKIFKKINEEAK